MNKGYLLNTNSKKVHILKFSDGRCKLKDMNEKFLVYFNTLTEALSYPNTENPLGELCTICRNNKIKKEKEK